jgi:tetratricopeptide (TPR) repeat protein
VKLFRLVSSSFIVLLLALVAAITSAAQTAELAAKAQRGRDAMAAGRFQEAAGLYAEIVKAMPDEPGMHLNLGMALAMAGEPARAIAPLERAVQLDGQLFPAWLFLGSSYLDLRQPDKAVRPLEKAVALDPSQVEARQTLVEALLMLERHAEASEHLYWLADLDPADAKAWFLLGRSYEAEARQAFEALQEASPDSPYVHLLVGDVLATEGNYVEAIELFRRALERLPAHRDGHDALLQLYDVTGDVAAAAETKARLAGLPPLDCASASAECEFLAGRHRTALGVARKKPDPESRYWQTRAAHELAMDAFSRVEAMPDSPEAHLLRAHLHQSSGRHVEAAAELRQALKLAPDDPAIQRALAEALYLSRAHEEAEPLLAALLKRQPDDPELAFLYGDVLLLAQRAEQAIPFLRVATTKEPELLEAHSSLGRAYMQTGRAAEAIPHLEAALPLDEDGSLHYQLARAYQLSGQPARAAEMLKKYQELQAGEIRF